MVISLIETVIGPNSYTSDTPPGDTTHTVSRPASAVSGTYVVVEIAMSVPGSNVTSTVTAPSGWALITGGRDSGTPSPQGYAYGKVMGGSEPSSYSWTYDVASNVLSQIHVFSGVDPVTPFVEADYLAQASSGTSRATPTINTAATRFVRYSTHDRNASNPTAPENGTKVNNTQTSSTSLTTAYIGTTAAGSYSRTFTGAASTSAAGSYIYALNPASAAYSGTVTLSGSGTLTATGAPAIPGSSTLSGSGALTAAGTPAVPGSATLSGAGALSLSGAPAVGDDVDASGSGTLALSGTPAFTVSVPLTGSGTLTVSGVPHFSGTVALTGNGSLDFATAPAIAAAVALAGTGTLAISGVASFPGTVRPTRIESERLASASVSSSRDRASLTSYLQKGVHGA